MGWRTDAAYDASRRAEERALRRSLPWHARALLELRAVAIVAAVALLAWVTAGAPGRWW